MLNKLPTWLPELPELLSDLGLSASDVPAIARALDVSERTVWRWKATKAPRMALLSLWWLSRWGHSLWDCEMANRTQLALNLRDALWREVTKLRQIRRLDDATASGIVGRPQLAANEDRHQATRDQVLRARPPGGQREELRRG